MVSLLIVTLFYFFSLCSSPLAADSNAGHHQQQSTPTNNDIKNSGPSSATTINIPPSSSGKDAKYVDYKTPSVETESNYFYESFDDVHKFKRTWVKSEATKGINNQFKYDGTWDIVVTHQKIRGDYGLRMRSKSKHHAISRKLDRPFTFTDTSLIVQYDVQYRNGQECGGAYLKLLTAPSGNLSLINDRTPYTIMFGPDKCGSDHRLHFIFAHINNRTGQVREIHWKNAHTIANLADVVTDGKWHLFRLTIKPDNSFEISMDKRTVGSGNLLSDFSPPVNPPAEIDDPNDVKPEDWDEREKVPDPDAVKPDDWDNDEPKMIPDLKAKKPKGWLEDEPPTIPDPDAAVPVDWNDDEGGEWQPPMIKNPLCISAPGCGQWNPPMIENPRHKGEWTPPLISNPAYQGKWTPRKIPNPDYFQDSNPYLMPPIDAVAFELWTLSDGIVFDNILLTSDPALADYVAASSFQIKKELNDLETDNWFKNLIKQTNKKPWLWAIYLIVAAVPVVLFIGFCCVTPGSGGLAPPDCQSSKSKARSTSLSSFTESCKINHEQHAFRYRNAYPVDTETSGHCGFTDLKPEPSNSCSTPSPGASNESPPACCSFHPHRVTTGSASYGYKKFSNSTDNCNSNFNSDETFISRDYYYCDYVDGNRGPGYNDNVDLDYEHFHGHNGDDGLLIDDHGYGDELFESMLHEDKLLCNGHVNKEMTTGLNNLDTVTEDDSTYNYNNYENQNNNDDIQDGDLIDNFVDTSELIDNNLEKLSEHQQQQKQRTDNQQIDEENVNKVLEECSADQTANDNQLIVKEDEKEIICEVINETDKLLEDNTVRRRKKSKVRKKEETGNKKSNGNGKGKNRKSKARRD